MLELQLGRPLKVRDDDHVKLHVRLPNSDCMIRSGFIVPSGMKREAARGETKRDCGRPRNRGWFEQSVAKGFANGQWTLQEDEADFTAR